MHLLIPIFAGLVGFLVRRWAGGGAKTHYVLPAALAASFAVGALMLMSGQLVPQRHWHWLPYCVLLAAVLAPWRPGHSQRDAVRLVVLCGLGLISAWLMVPTWDSLSPSRAIYVPAVGVYLVSLTITHERLAVRYSERTILACFALTALALAAAVSAQVSLTYGSLAMVAAAGLMGSLAAAQLAQTECETRGLMAAYVIAVAGAAWVGFIEPEPPFYALALIPALPLLSLAVPRSNVPDKPPAGRPSFEWVPITIVLVGAAVLLSWVVISGMAQPEEVPWDSDW